MAAVNRKIIAQRTLIRQLSMFLSIGDMYGLIASLENENEAN